MTDKNLMLEQLLGQAGEKLGSEIAVKRDFPLSRCSTFKIGGTADFVIYPKNADELVAVYRAARKAGISVYMAGNASNILFDDAGFRGAVIFTTAMRQIDLEGETIRADCGVSLTALSSYACKNSLSGLEFLYGIPGTVGGGLYMNCGAFGGQLGDALIESSYYDPDTDELVTIGAEAHDFGYRKSCFIGTNRVILSAVFRGTPGESENIRREMEDHMDYRSNSQPIDLPSAGSVFKRYPGYYTSRLIEEAGLKGRTVGGAQVSTKHAGFIVNLGDATAADVKALIEIIKDEIYEKNGIHIECEVIFAPSH